MSEGRLIKKLCNWFYRFHTPIRSASTPLPPKAGSQEWNFIHKKLHSGEWSQYLHEGSTALRGLWSQRA